MKSPLLLRFVLNSVLLGLAWCAQTSAMALGDGPAILQPTITEIRLEGKEVVVTAQVPAGIRKVTLQSSRQLGTGAWEPRAVLRLDGAGGAVTFRCPSSPELEILRVRADDSEPLPSLFYQGTNDFPGVRVSDSFGFPGMEYYAIRGDAAGGPATEDGAPARDVVESDIWQTRGDSLYFFNQYRGLQVIDVADPDAPIVRGTLPLPAAGEQMYLLGDHHVVLLARDGCGWAANSTSRILVVDTTQAAPTVSSSLEFPGDIQESRMVGAALYVMTQLYQPVAESRDGAWEWGTAVYAFDLANPAAPVARPSLWYAGYGNVLTATEQFLFISVNGGSNNSLIHCIDISAPDGVMTQASSIPVAGRVPDKFKMHLNGEIFTVISEEWRSDSSSEGARWRTVTKLETFDLANPAAPLKLGELELADGEQLHATRFDGDRVYVVTFFRVDPLWVVDLSDPTRPAITGELHVPGWSTYIQPFGDRLVTIGIDDTNGWRVAVSLFDVRDPAAPALLSKVPLGENSSWSEANTDEKAFGFLPDAGLILVPYSAYSTKSEQGVQLIDFSPGGLTKRGFISHDMEARRSTLHRGRILSISGRELLSVDATDRDKPAVLSELELAWPVNRVFAQGEFLVELEDSASWNGVVNPSIRVVRKTAPDQILNALSLTNLPLTGATLRDGRLYLLQGATTYYPIVAVDDEKPAVEGTNRTVLVCSVVDTTKLPAIEVISSVELVTGQSFIGSAEPVWPKPDLLVWVAQQSGYWGPWIYTIDFAGDMMIMPGLRGGFWRPFPSYGESTLYAVDTSDPLAPRFVSEVALGGANTWGSFSKPQVADGSVFLSEQFTETIITGTNQILVTNVVYVLTNGVITSADGDYVEVDGTKGADGNWVKVPQSIILTNTQPVYASRQISWLHVVDYAAPSTPVLRKPVTIPGALRGLSPDGALLYLVGYELDSEQITDGVEWLHACAYDGVACHLVDSTPLSKEWPHAILVAHPHAFVSRPQSGETISRALEIWTINESARFQKLHERPVAANVHTLHRVGDLLVAQEETGLELFDATRPTELPRVGASGPFGCLGWNVEAATGSLNEGLWLPLDLYGVYQVRIER